MRRCVGQALALVMVLLAGCLTDKPTYSTSLFQRFLPARPVPSDAVRMDVALVEGSIGDPFLNEELWAMADDQVIPPEQRALLEDNGFWIAQIGGMMPPDLQRRLMSAKTCIDPRRLEAYAGKPTTVLLGPPLARCKFEVRQEGAAAPASLEQAQCVVVVIASPASGGRSHLHFAPQIQTGPKQQVYAPADDHSGWVYQEKQATQTYPALEWDVTLAPNEFVLVGGRSDLPDSLGHACFVRLDERPPKQRLLVIRTGRTKSTNDSAPAEEGCWPAEVHSPPLALQAAWSTVRGSEP